MGEAGQRQQENGSGVEHAPARAAGRVGAAAAVIFILGIHVVGRVGSFCSPVRADSYAYTCIGYRVAHGEPLYSETLSDVKPPLLYHLYGLVYLVLPPGRLSVVPIDTLFGLLGYWATYLLARDLFGRKIGLVVTVVAAMAYNALIVWDFGTEGFGLAESYMVLPAAMAARAYRRGVLGDRNAAFLACGLWLGIEASIKQTVLPLAATIAVHWTALSLFRSMNARRWLRGSLAIGAGVVAALLPWIVFLAARGTLLSMIEVMRTGAVGQLAKFTARPDQWSNVLPLWLPMAWCVFGLLWWGESTWRNRRDRTGFAVAFSSSDLLFLLVWLGLEYVMLIYLPFRSFHYYVVSCIPLVMLSGLMWAGLGASRRSLPARPMLAAGSVAAVLSLAFARTTLDTVIPIAIARLRAYDAGADRAFFDSMVDRPVINFGVPSQPPEE
jgi:hypothetical protein